VFICDFKWKQSGPDRRVDMKPKKITSKVSESIMIFSAVVSEQVSINFLIVQGTKDKA